MQTITKGVLDKDQQSLTLKQRDRFNQLVQSGIDPKIARQLAIALTKSTAAAVAKGGKPLDAAPAPLMTTEEVMQLTRDWPNPVDVANAAMRAARVAKSYSRSFVASAKDQLPKAYFDQLHAQARGRAGGQASGMSRRASGDDDKAALLDERKQLKDRLAAIEVELAKSGPVAQEVSVDAPIKVDAKEKKRRDKLAERIAAQAIQAVKNAPPLGKERVKFQLPATLVKSSAQDYKRIIHAVVYAPGERDAHGDYMDADTIEKMAHDAMRSGLYVNHEHVGGPLDVDVVESYVAPIDLNLSLPAGEPYVIPKGAHVMGFHVRGDDTWQKVLSGDYRGISLEGTALRDIA